MFLPINISLFLSLPQSLKSIRTFVSLKDAGRDQRFGISWQVAGLVQEARWKTIFATFGVIRGERVRGVVTESSSQMGAGRGGKLDISPLFS